jgi:hypothetical protein
MVTLMELGIGGVRIREQRQVRVGLEHEGQIGLLNFPCDIEINVLRDVCRRGLCL